MLSNRLKLMSSRSNEGGNAPLGTVPTNVNGCDTVYEKMRGCKRVCTRR